MYRFVYKTTNLINNKVYIGQHSTNNLDDGYLGSGTLICRSIKKYGKENFKREILEFCDSIEELNEREMFLIKQFSSFDINLGYNIITNFSIEQNYYRNRASKRSKEFCLNVSERMKGDNNPSIKYGPWNKGKSWGKDFRNNISKSHKENKVSYFKNNPRYKDIEENTFKNIVIDLENGYGSVKDLSLYYGINEQRLFRHLYYNYILFIEDLPKYLQKNVIKHE